ncbi:MAG: RluA family pseudouridine synthase [Coprobacillus sp.]|nr:RluA family pseudouridine synthase [Coprobacillus sp.]
MREFVVTDGESGQTLEKYIKKLLVNAPLSFIYKTFRKEDIKVNGKHAKRETTLNENDIVAIYITEEAFNSFLYTDKIIPSDVVKEWILYEDENILAINKPKGILVTDAENSQEKTLETMVLEYLYSKGEYDPETSPTLKPGPAHRLDRNTSGVVLFGKNVKALQSLFSLMKDKNSLKKRYYTLVKGVVDEGGMIDVPLKKDEKTNLVRVSSKEAGGKSAYTRYEVVHNFKEYTLLRVTLLSGRTHQIRVHMAYINHPVIGDNKYGDFELNKLFKEKYDLRNQFLEAYEIEFNKTNETLKYLEGTKINAPLDKDFMDILQHLEN